MEWARRGLEKLCFCVVLFGKSSAVGKHVPESAKGVRSGRFFQGMGIHRGRRRLAGPTASLALASIWKRRNVKNVELPHRAGVSLGTQKTIRAVSTGRTSLALPPGTIPWS